MLSPTGPICARTIARRMQLCTTWPPRFTHSPCICERTIRRRAQLIKGAISAIRLALERDAGDERLWNALGVVCGEAGKQLALHAFVVSLELLRKGEHGHKAVADRQDPITWTNLGYLYLRLDDWSWRISASSRLKLSIPIMLGHGSDKDCWLTGTATQIRLVLSWVMPSPCLRGHS